MDYVTSVFNNNHLLARAMDFPFLRRINDQIVYDFSTWANEIEFANNDGLYSLSTTLILPNESIPTYKSIGFLVDSTKANVRHVSPSDSCSHGNDLNGDFWANDSGITSIEELVSLINKKHDNVMNEVNVNIHQDAIIGLFVNAASSTYPLASIILVQKILLVQTGILYPIYIYDSKLGKLAMLNMSEEDKINFIKESMVSRKVKSSILFCATELGDIKEQDFFDDVECKRKR